jgi:hypothetical protein
MRTPNGTLEKLAEVAPKEWGAIKGCRLVSRDRIGSNIAYLFERPEEKLPIDSS